MHTFHVFFEAGRRKRLTMRERKVIAKAFEFDEKELRYLKGVKFNGFSHVELCNHHHHLISEYFPRPQRTLCSLAVTPHSAPSLQSITTNPLSLWRCLFWTFHANRIT